MSESDLKLARNATSQLQVLAQQQELCWTKNKTDPLPGRGYCGRTFDGISCWEPASAGSLVSQQCPEYFRGFYSQNTMTKLCTEDGSWFFSTKYNSFWTNYTSCSVRPPHLPSTAILSEHLGIVNYTDNHLLQMMTPVIKHISRVGYGISLSALVVAMVIFCSVRKLRTCPRNSLHMHLFMSFILKASMWVAMDVVPQELLVSSDTRSWLCKSVTAIWQYFTLANYSWVTMEGLYLFCLIHLAMFSDHSRITAYVALGLGFPVCFVVPWVVVRALKEDFYCWRVNINEAYFWIIRAPTIALILVNAVLFVFIILVLLQKLNASISAETRRYRKLARSTLVLMPLFGFHYVLLIGLSAFINVNHVIELIWLFWDQLFASFQGFSVALLYCFLNSEVKQELRKLYINWRFNNFGNPSSSSGRRTARNDRQTARSSVQSTTLLDKTSEMANNSRTPSPNPQARSAANRLQTHKEEEERRGEMQDEMQEHQAGSAGDVSGSLMRPVDTTVTYSRAGGSERIQLAVTAPN